ncbi:MAG: ADP-forming succinate--CoA ligase subunit beta [Erysipelotrichaceae bacterium]|nr:ADP-forming succinate--CoA ligase subunit beta [Erysipelotrichaceae bacterium]MBQ5805022.1 ADP-forming succinate--CoA ligase subunit beta [Erysipelotrichaceae bacterium]
MNIHEYQAKQMMDRYGIPVPEGYPADNIEEVEQIMDLHFPDGKIVVKAQIHSGGRGKAGGVILANTKEEAIEAARKLFGKTLVTKQTGPQGKLVRKVYIEKQSQIEREIYLSLLIDTNVGRHTFVACGEGGTSIEELAETAPEKIIKETIDPSVGFCKDTATNIAERLELNDTNSAELTDILSHMYEMFIQEDCTLIEINPLAICNGHLMALDAKVTLDSDAMFRHKENLELQDLNEEDPLELEASAFGMNYVSLSGNIGCICNGAGLGMSSMDTIYHYGGKPANFMDTGGTITVDKAYKAFEIVSRGENVKGIIVNIFGGIARTDLIAEGIVKAMDELNYEKPVVVRIEGNRAETAHETLKNARIPVILAENCSDAVKKMLKKLEED